MTAPVQTAVVIFFLLISRSSLAQQDYYRDDSVVEKKIGQIISKFHAPVTAEIDTKKSEHFAALRMSGNDLSRKYEFLVGMVNASSTGGGKSGKKLENYTLPPFLNYKEKIVISLDAIHSPSIQETEFSFRKIAVILKTLYTEIKGNDDENTKVEVSIKVFESYAGRKEMPGYSVYSENPFVTNSREDFNPTVWAIKKISPGWQEFHVKKGSNKQKKYWHVIAGDQNTHLVLFSERQ